MTTAILQPGPRRLRTTDRLALRVGMALVHWAGRRVERALLTAEQRHHRMAMEQLQLERELRAYQAMLGR